MQSMSTQTHSIGVSTRLQGHKELSGYLHVLKGNARIPRGKLLTASSSWQALRWQCEQACAPGISLSVGRVNPRRSPKVRAIVMVIPAAAWPSSSIARKRAVLP